MLYVACDSMSFFFKANTHCINILHILFIHSSICGCLGCFYTLATVNKAAGNFGAQTSVQVPAFSSFRNTPRKGMTGSYGSAIFNLKNLCMVFHHVCINVHSHPQCTRVPFPPHPPNTYYFSVFRL